MTKADFKSVRQVPDSLGEHTRPGYDFGVLPKRSLVKSPGEPEVTCSRKKVRMRPEAFGEGGNMAREDASG